MLMTGRRTEMACLDTDYLGLSLKNPLLPSASPLSRAVDSARHLEDAGASGIVMYSLFEEQILAEERQYDRFGAHQDLGHGEASSFLPQPSGFRSTLDRYLEQLALLKRSLGIPVIASLNGTSREGWLDFGLELQQAGADALELNVYYVAGNPEESGGDVEQRYLDVLTDLKAKITIPIAVKITSQFSSPLNFVHRLQQAGADAVVIFNRFYQSDINLESLSVEPALQLSLPYEALLRIRWAAMIRGAVDIDIAVTGGFHEADASIKALLAGANTVQLCSTLLTHGPARLGEVLKEIEQWLDDHEYESVRQMQGSLSSRNAADPAAYERQNYLSVLGSFTPPPGVRY
jgi:dihydroorotate dehydrogenase (fumarate)